jgi:hypothetical protein
MKMLNFCKKVLLKRNKTKIELRERYALLLHKIIMLFCSHSTLEIGMIINGEPIFPLPIKPFLDFILTRSDKKLDQATFLFREKQEIPLIKQ